MGRGEILGSSRPGGRKRTTTQLQGGGGVYKSRLLLPRPSPARFPCFLLLFSSSCLADLIGYALLLLCPRTLIGAVCSGGEDLHFCFVSKIMEAEKKSTSSPLPSSLVEDASGVTTAPNSSSSSLFHSVFPPASTVRYLLPPSVSRVLFRLLARNASLCRLQYAGGLP